MGARGDSYYEYLLKQDIQRPGMDGGRYARPRGGRRARAGN